MPSQKETLAEQFKVTVCFKSDVVDPQGEQDWYSLSLGWALAQGLDPDEAHEFAQYVRYDKNHWQGL